MARPPFKRPQDNPLASIPCDLGEALDTLVSVIERRHIPVDETVTLWIASPISTLALETLALGLAYKLPKRKFALYDRGMSRIIVKDAAGVIIEFDGCIPC
jgi:hypothetical protein